MSIGGASLLKLGSEDREENVIFMSYLPDARGVQDYHPGDE
jgi:hypothetical protein